MARLRFGVVVSWSAQAADVDMQMYGTWQTRDAAQGIVDRFERSIAREIRKAGDNPEDFDQLPAAWVVEIVPKLRMRLRERVRAWLEAGAR